MCRTYILCVLLILEEKIMARRFEIDDTITRHYRRYNAVGKQLTLRLLPPRMIVIL